MAKLVVNISKNSKYTKYRNEQRRNLERHLLTLSPIDQTIRIHQLAAKRATAKARQLSKGLQYA